MTQVGADPVRLPKRFYGAATLEAGALLLDGKSAKTKRGRALSSAHPALMQAVAAEWNAQCEFVRFATMPMTRYAMTLIDLADTDAPKWRGILASLLSSDLLCYRAREPDELVARQRAAWDPLLVWAAKERGVSLRCGEGVAFIAQPAAAIRAGEAAFLAATAAALLGMKEAAEISGSAVIALALAQGRFDAETLFAAARVDEIWQAERWGVDDDAHEREAGLRRAFLEAVQFLALAGRD